MLMPALSVTGIGIAIAVMAIIRGKPATGALLRGLLGAWLGFVAGAVPGVLLDIVLTNGVYVALLGHVGAAAGAIVAITQSRAVAATRRRPE
jgi:hypothetical protein